MTGQKEWTLAIAHSRGSGEFARVELSEHTGAYLLQGQPVQVSSAPKAGLVQLFHSLGTEERFIGIGEVLDDGKIAPRRLIAAQ